MPSMEEDIAKYPCYGLSNQGLVPIDIKSVNDYNHFTHQMHHYIKQQEWRRNKEWFTERGIKQKLILLPKHIHEYVHNQGIRNVSDQEFLKAFGVSRWELLFNRRYSAY